MPLLSKICPVCGYTEESGEAGQSPAEFAHKMEEILLRLKNIPSPTFFKSIGQLSFIMLPIIAVYMLVAALISEAGLFWLLFLLFLVLAIVAIVKKAKGTLGNDKADKQFRELKNEAEYNKRIAMHSFGSNEEVASILNEIYAEIDHVERERRGASARNVVVWVVIMLVLFGAAGAGVFKMNKSLAQVEENPMVEQVVYINGVAFEGLQKAMDKVAAMSDSEVGVEQARLDVIGALLAASRQAEAEEFFLNSCMGQMKDFDCAALIVRHYVAAEQADAAKAFVGKCEKLRYNSDKSKLVKLIN